MKIAICLGLTAALTLASAALAADGPGRPDRDHRGGAERADANGDGNATLQETQAALRERLMRLDADHDGKITKAEMDARREHFQERRAERGAQRGQDVFARLDTDHSGQLSPSEFAAGREQMRERRAARGGEHRDGHPRMGHRGPGARGEPGERFAALDADSDGAVSAAELDRAAAERFSTADANHDGALSADERSAARRDHRGPRD